MLDLQINMISGKSELQLFGEPPKQGVVNNAAFVDYLPVTALGDGITNIEYQIQGSDVDYLDLNDSFLCLKLKVLNDDNSNLDAASKTHATNYFLNALFSDVKLFLNETLIEGGSPTYAYKSTIESIFNFNEDAKRIQLLPGGFSDEVDEREKWIKNSTSCEVIGALRLDFFSQPKYILNKVNVRIELNLSKNEFGLTMPAGDAALAKKPKIRIYAASLYVRRVQVDPAVRIGHEIGLKTQNAMYPYQKSEVITGAIAAKSLFYTKDNVFGHTQMPKFVVVGMVRGDAYNGDYEQDPFHFGAFNVLSLGLYRDGEPVPTRKIYNCDFPGNRVTEAYFTSIILNTQHFNTNMNNGIRMEDFKQDGGYTFYTFNLAPDFDMHQRQQIADGNLRLEIRFRKETAVAINVIVYGLFDGLVEITGDRKVVKG